MPTEGQAVVVGILSRHKQAIEDMRAVLRDPAGGGDQDLEVRKGLMAKEGGKQGHPGEGSLSWLHCASMTSWPLQSSPSLRLFLADLTREVIPHLLGHLTPRLTSQGVTLPGRHHCCSVTFNLHSPSQE